MAKKDLQLVIKAKDEASKTLQGISGTFSGMAKKLTSLPALIGIGLSTAAVVKFAKDSLAAYNVQAKAEANLERALANSQGQVARSSAELKAYASQLQQTTTFGDEAIINAQAIQLAFSNITTENFDRVTKSAMDVAAALGTDLETEVKKLAKALNDPEEGMTSLAKIGVAFTKQQEDQIRTMTRSGKVLEAQGILIEEVEKRYKGAAAAFANTSEGRLKQLQNRFGDFLEVVGAKLSILQDWAVEVGGKALGYLESGFNKAMTIGTAFFQAIRGTVSSVFTSVWESVKTIFNGIWSTISTVWESVSNLLGSSGDSFMADLLEGLKALQDGVTITFAIIEAYVKNFGKQWVFVGEFIGYQLAKMVNTIAYYFTDVIPEYLAWFGRNWQSVLTDYANFSFTVWKNIGENIVNIITGLPALISGKASFADIWKPLTDGFKSAITEDLPKIAQRTEGLLEQTLKSNMEQTGKEIADSYSSIIEQRLKQANQQIEDTKAKADKAVKDMANLPGAGAGGSEDEQKVKSLADTIKDALAPAVAVMGQTLLGVQQSGQAKDDPIYRETKEGNRLAGQQVRLLSQISENIKSNTGPQIIIEPLGLRFA